MRLKGTLPLSKMTKDQQAIWLRHYIDLGKPEGHIISSTIAKTVCHCITGNETIKHVNIKGK